MHCDRDLNQQAPVGFIFLFKLYASLSFCLLSLWDPVLGAREGFGRMILMHIFLAALQERALHPALHRQTKRASRPHGKRKEGLWEDLSSCTAQLCPLSASEMQPGSPTWYSASEIFVEGRPLWYTWPRRQVSWGHLGGEIPHAARSQGSNLFPAFCFGFQQQSGFCGCRHPLAQ